MDFKLRELRKKRNLTQVELGDLLGISHQNISKYETGLIVPDIFILAKLADFFDVTLDYLVGRNFHEYKYDKSSSYVSEKLLINEYNKYDRIYKDDILKLLRNISAEELKLLSAYIDLPIEERSKLIQLMESICKIYSK